MSELNPYKQQASKSIQELIQEITLLKLRIADLESQLRWIPVSENPTKDGYYLTKNDNCDEDEEDDHCYPQVYYFDSAKWVLNNLTFNDWDVSVTHWRPLPEALKKVKE